MRQGNNPLRNAMVDGYRPIVLGAITHLPTLNGYHERRFEVVRACLESMRWNSEMDVDIMVWDNGSCQEFRDWLLQLYRPDFVVLSRNIGKASARTGIIRSLPPETIVGVTDDDIWFYPGWLEASLKIFRHFPGVGQVSGYPVRTQFRWGNQQTLDWARKNAQLEPGRFILEKWDRDFCTSIGRDYAFQVGYTEKDLDYKITYNGLSAFGVAHHCQFIAQAGRIARFAKWDNAAMGDEKPFDIAIDDAGLLRLTTTQRFTRHIGNVLDEDIMEMYQKLMEEVTC